MQITYFIGASEQDITRDGKVVISRFSITCYILYTFNFNPKNKHLNILHQWMNSYDTAFKEINYMEDNFNDSEI